MFTGDTTRDLLQVSERADGWGWRRVSGNRKIISSGEGYTRRRDAIRGGERANPGMEAQVIERGPAKE